MKKRFVFFIFVFIFCHIFAEKNEINPLYPDASIYFYLPSFNKQIVGGNPTMQIRENYNVVENCIILSQEGRFSLVKLNNGILSWSITIGGYSEANKLTDNYTSLNMGLGLGVFFPNDDEIVLKGLSFFVYPMYQVPIYVEGKSDYKWGTAFDIGYSFVFNKFIFYPYAKCMMAWYNSDFRVATDCGIAIGLYYDD